MRIIFTDKLSKMVAHYENLRDWGFGEESVQVLNMHKIYWQ